MSVSFSDHQYLCLGLGKYLLIYFNFAFNISLENTTDFITKMTLPNVERVVIEPKVQCTATQKTQTSTTIPVLGQFLDFSSEKGLINNWTNVISANSIGTFWYSVNEKTEDAREHYLVDTWWFNVNKNILWLCAWEGPFCSSNNQMGEHSKTVWIGGQKVVWCEGRYFRTV